jgi:hypothetical protein
MLTDTPKEKVICSSKQAGLVALGSAIFGLTL